MDESRTLTLVFRSLIPMRWGDEDSLSHINNTIYFRYMEQARIEWLASVGLPLRGDQRETAVLAEGSCRFLLPLTYPGVVECKVFSAPPGRTSLIMRYELRREGEDRLYATGDSRLVWIDRISGKPTPWPDSLRQLLPSSKTA